jgi:hypothetical protein
VEHNNRILEGKIQNIKEKQVALNEIVPFVWTSIYTFEPYLPVDKQEQILEIQFNALEESVNVAQTIQGIVYLDYLKSRKYQTKNVSAA